MFRLRAPRNAAIRPHSELLSVSQDIIGSAMQVTLAFFSHNFYDLSFVGLWCLRLCQACKFRQNAVKRRSQDNEKDVPTQQQQTEKGAWLPRTYGHQGRPAGAQAQTRQGAQKAYGEWLTRLSRPLKISRVPSVSFVPRTTRRSIKPVVKFIRRILYCSAAAMPWSIAGWE